MACVERVEAGLDNVEVIGVEVVLEYGGARLLSLSPDLAGAPVTLVVAHVQLDVLRDELLLLCLEIDKLLGVNHHGSAIGNTGQLRLIKMVCLCTVGTRLRRHPSQPKPCLPLRLRDASPAP